MIIQTYEVGSHLKTYGQKDQVIYWDQANQVKQYRVSYDKLDEDFPTNRRESDWTGYTIIDNSSSPEGREPSKNYVRVVHWNDRITGQPYMLFSDEDVFILNDEGKTFVRV